MPKSSTKTSTINVANGVVDKAGVPWGGEYLS